MNCVAIDFETANADRSSACALGIAIIEGHEIVSRESWLIRPPELYFDWYNTYIHGITEEDVADQPKFNKLWDKFRQYFEGRLVIAHNASFDMSVLRHILDRYRISYPRFNYFCTRVIAKRTWPKLVSYSLPIVAGHLGIDFKHHDAEEDAAACAQVALQACSNVGVSSLEELAEKTEITKGQLYPGGYKPSGLKPTYERPKAILPTTDRFDHNHPFFGKTVVFTGALQSMVRREAMQKLVDRGGVCAGSIGMSTNYLVLGDQDLAKLRGKLKSSKLRKAEELIAGGADLELLPETEFLEMLEE